MRFPRYSSESNSSRHFSIGIGVRSKQIVVGSKLRFRLEQIFGLIVDIDGKPVELPTQMAHLGVEGRIVRRDLEHTDVKAVVSRITELVGELRALRPDLDEQNSLRGVGVAIGGHINGKTGEVVSSPQMGWESPVPLAALLKETTGLKTVVVENDVNAVAVGAQFFRDVARAVPAGVDPASYSSFAVVSVTTGIGVGLVFGTEVYRGVEGAAGEFGHFPVEEAGRPCVCGKNGCLETVAGGTAILEAIREAGRRDIETLEEAAAFLRNGDEDARHAFEQAGKALGRGLAGLVNLLNLRLIVLCGEPVLLRCDPYMTRVRQSFPERAFSTTAKVCELWIESRTDELEARGAASLVFEHLHDDLLNRQPE